jgi:hypothetical protein
MAFTEQGVTMLSFVLNKSIEFYYINIGVDRKWNSL